jgi:hypothetical protein
MGVSVAWLRSRSFCALLSEADFAGADCALARPKVTGIRSAPTISDVESSVLDFIFISIPFAIHGT